MPPATGDPSSLVGQRQPLVLEPDALVLHLAQFDTEGSDPLVVGGVLGEAKVNIEDMNVGKDPSGEGSLMVVTTTQATPAKVVEVLRTGDGIESVQSIG